MRITVNQKTVVVINRTKNLAIRIMTLTWHLTFGLTSSRLLSKMKVVQRESAWWIRHRFQLAVFSKIRWTIKDKIWTVRKAKRKRRGARAPGRKTGMWAAQTMMSVWRTKMRNTRVAMSSALRQNQLKKLLLQRQSFNCHLHPNNKKLECITRGMHKCAV